MRNKRIYLDYAASTPVHPEVEKAMRPYFLEKFGNAGSLHSFGQEAMAAIDHAREIIAFAIGAKFREIIFTGSATEANNLALRGSVKNVVDVLNVVNAERNTYNKRASASDRTLQHPRIIVSAIEHESVLETARDLEKDGVEAVIIPVSRSGIVDLKKLEAALNERTVLVSVMYANNEIGTIQPIAEISRIIRNFREVVGVRNVLNVVNVPNGNYNKRANASDRTTRTIYPLFHSDAAQAFQFLDCNVSELGVDLMTLSAHKIYGPKGIGVLYVRNVLNVVNVPNGNYNKRANASDRTSRTLEPIVTGGGQEFDFRSGTENVPLIVGFGKAVELVSHSRELENKRISSLRDAFWNGLKKIAPRAEVNGRIIRTTRIASERPEYSYSGHSDKFVGSDYVPHILNVYFPHHEAQDLLTRFDMAGIAVSAGSACAARSAEPSYVIEAIGYSKERAKRSIRFSFGRPTTKKDIHRALMIIGKLLR